jgi:hypothetical protein
MCGTRAVQRFLEGKGGRKRKIYINENGGCWKVLEECGCKKGISRLKRMEDVGKYLRNMGVKRRRTRTLEGTEWASQEL